jgi:hypothetical protein
VDIESKNTMTMRGNNQQSGAVATSFNILGTSDNVDSDDEANQNTYGSHHVNKTKKYVLIDAYKVPKNFLTSVFSSFLDSEFGPMLKPTEVCFHHY